MFRYLKREWRELKKGRPGRRFRDRCERARQSRADKSAVRRFVVPVVGVLILAAGLVFCVIPGPGLPLVAIGGALLAQHSMTMAIALDWVEVKLRYLFGRAIGWWREASLATRNAVIALAVLMISVASYGAYHVIFRH